jgi:P27 family predicted phage terminase small subunit
MEIARVLDSMKVLNLSHGHALEQMACNLVEIREIREEIEKTGRFQNVRMTNGAKKQTIRPAVLALSDAEKRWRAMMEQFGMTASAETRVNARPEEEESKDPAQKYFKPRLVPPAGK